MVVELLRRWNWTLDLIAAVRGGGFAGNVVVGRDLQRYWNS